MPILLIKTSIICFNLITGKMLLLNIISVLFQLNSSNALTEMFEKHNGKNYKILKHKKTCKIKTYMK